MTLFECMKTYLSGSATLAAKVTGGVFPGFLPQNPSTPLCTMRYISGASEPPTQDGGPSPWSMCRLEFTFWGLDYKTNEQCARILDDLFSVSTPVYLGSSPNGLFSPRQIQGPRDVRDPETRLTGIQIDVIGLLNGDTLS